MLLFNTTTEPHWLGIDDPPEVGKDQPDWTDFTVAEYFISHFAVSSVVWLDNVSKAFRF